MKMLQRLCLATCLVSMAGLLRAQGDIPLSIERYESIPPLPPPTGGILPEAHDLSPFFPTPGTQSSMDCTAWSLCYVKTYHEARELSLSPDDEKIAFSPSFIYNQIKNYSCNSGSSIVDGVEILKTQGVATRSIFPYNPNDCTAIPDSATIQCSRAYRARELYRVNPQSQASMKGHLFAGNPVVISFRTTTAFENFRGSAPYKVPDSESVTGHHAMVVVGYDDRMQAYKLINSWGTQWGDGGFGWVDYATFRSFVNNAYVVEDSRTEVGEICSGGQVQPVATPVAPTQAQDVFSRIARLIAGHGPNYLVVDDYDRVGMYTQNVLYVSEVDGTERAIDLSAQGGISQLVVDRPTSTFYMLCADGSLWWLQSQNSLMRSPVFPGVGALVSVSQGYVAAAIPGTQSVSVHGPDGKVVYSPGSPAPVAAIEYGGDGTLHLLDIYGRVMRLAWDGTWLNGADNAFGFGVGTDPAWCNGLPLSVYGTSVYSIDQKGMFAFSYASGANLLAATADDPFCAIHATRAGVFTFSARGRMFVYSGNLWYEGSGAGWTPLFQ